MKKGEFYRDVSDQKVYQYLGKAEYTGANTELAILKCFEDEKTYARNKEFFEKSIDEGFYVKEAH